MQDKKKTRHHLIPKSRRNDFKGRYRKEDFNKTLSLWKIKHYYWHGIFGNASLDEIIEILKRIKKIKKL